MRVYFICKNNKDCIYIFIDLYRLLKVLSCSNFCFGSYPCIEVPYHWCCLRSVTKLKLHLFSKIVNEPDDNDDMILADEEYRNRFRVRCPILGCPYLDNDSIPNKAIILDMFTDKDKKHIEKFHPSC